ncbi:MAG: hypothetical protein ACPGMR_13040 [Pontibacterium sp.]
MMRRSAEDLELLTGSRVVRIEFNPQQADYMKFHRELHWFD